MGELVKSAAPFSSFDQLPADVRSLFDSAASGSFFSGVPWFQAFEKYALNADDGLRIYSVAAETSAATQAALPMVQRTGRLGFLKSRRLCSLTSYYSSLYAPVWRGPSVREAAKALVAAIAVERPRWDEIELRPLDVNDATFGALVDALKEAGYAVQTFFCFGNWYLEVNGRSYAEYMESLPPSLKSRRKKKLEKSGRGKIDIVTGGEGLDEAIEAYNKIYLASWKQPEPYPHFVPELIRTCAALGSARLGLLYVDGEPAAAQFWIVSDGKALIYKIAYDERFAELSVGTILTTTMMQRAIDVEQVHTIDYLAGDDAYKKNWMSHRRERWGILAMNPRTPHGCAAIARHVGGRALKRFANSLSVRMRGPDRTSATA